MTTQPRCRAHNRADCRDHGTPKQAASFDEFLAQQQAAPAGKMPTRWLAGVGRGHTTSDEGNYTARNGKRIAAEMVEHGTQDSYMHEIMANAQTKPTYLLAVSRDEFGPAGYLEYHVDRSPVMPEVVIHNVRARQTHDGKGEARDSKGAGSALLRHAAQVALAQKNPKTVLVIQGAVESARPFYAKMGGETSATSSMVHFSRAAVEALAAGAPIRREHPAA
jgi:hypothetical protein